MFHFESRCWHCDWPNKAAKLYGYEISSALKKRDEFISIRGLPQVAEMNIPQPMDAAGKNRQYDEYMTRLYLSNATPEESSAFRLMLLDTTLEVVGEAADWFTTVVEVPISHVDMLLLDWDMLPINSPGAALNELRMVCPSTLIVIFISEQDAQKQAALSIAADMFITKGETPKRIAERLEVVAAGGLAQ